MLMSHAVDLELQVSRRYSVGAAIGQSSFAKQRSNRTLLPIHSSLFKNLYLRASFTYCLFFFLQTIAFSKQNNPHLPPQSLQVLSPKSRLLLKVCLGVTPLFTSPTTIHPGLKSRSSDSRSSLLEFSHNLQQPQLLKGIPHQYQTRDCVYVTTGLAVAL
jgi:hypothetical protein